MFNISFPDIDECLSSPCLNNGTCEDRVNVYGCKCFSGFAGANCGQGMDFIVGSLINSTVSYCSFSVH